MAVKLSLEAFRSALGEADSKSTFACGGSVPIILDSSPDSAGQAIANTASKPSDQVIVNRSVTIRYGPSGQGQILRLPTDTTKDPSFLRLISTCEPASFGRGGQDVFDESYRKATKLDPSEFCTDFCPYESGIIDIVSQLLLPLVKRKVSKVVEKVAPVKQPLSATVDDVRALFVATEGSMGIDSITLTEIITTRTNEELIAIMRSYESIYKRDLEQVLLKKLRGPAQEVLLDIIAEAVEKDRTGRRRKRREKETMSADTGIKAELYKLNIYSGPSGRFKAHVDTPRSESQIGSLVVCLPSEFEGGALSVSHQGNTVDFDWSTSSLSDQKPAIQWAAFYSDCCHEVHEVTAGHRMTLTYNLYASQGSGLLAGMKHGMDATKLPLYRPLINLLQSPDFKTSGGRVAIGLAHAYPYTHKTLHQAMPAALKGADMMLYETLLASGLNFEFIRVMNLKTEDDWGEDEVNTDGEWLDPNWGEERNVYRTGFEAMRISSLMIESHEMRKGLEGWKRLGRMEWLRWPRSSELEMAYLAYGNEASMGTKYSSAAIVIKIPSWRNRSETYRT